MFCSVHIRKFRNTWVIYERDNTSPVPEEVIDFRRRQNSGTEKKLDLYFDSKDESRLGNLINKFRRDLLQYKISPYLYDVDQSELSKIALNLIKETIRHELIYINHDENIFPNNACIALLPSLKRNKTRIDNEILNNYSSSILTLRKIFANKNSVNNLKRIVERIYIDPKHKFKHSMFDSEGKEIHRLFYSWYEWYPRELPKSDYNFNAGVKFMLACGAFGYENPYAIYFLAFERIIVDLEKLEEVKEWTKIDYLLNELIKQNLDLLHLFAKLKDQNLFNARKLIEHAPLAEIMPNNEIFLFEDTIDDAMKFELDNFYPNLKYQVVTS